MNRHKKHCQTLFESFLAVSGGATASYSSSESGGITSSGKFYLYNSGTKTVTATVGAPASAKLGDVYTVTFTYNAYDANGNDSGTQTKGC